MKGAHRMGAEKLPAGRNSGISGRHYGASHPKISLVMRSGIAAAYTQLTKSESLDRVEEPESREDIRICPIRS